MRIKRTLHVFQVVPPAGEGGLPRLHAAPAETRSTDFPVLLPTTGVCASRLCGCGSPWSVQHWLKRELLASIAEAQLRQQLRTPHIGLFPDNWHKIRDDAVSAWSMAWLRQGDCSSQSKFIMPLRFDLGQWDGSFCNSQPNLPFKLPAASPSVCFEPRRALLMR